MLVGQLPGIEGLRAGDNVWDNDRLAERTGENPDRVSSVKELRAAEPETAPRRASETRDTPASRSPRLEPYVTRMSQL